METDKSIIQERLLANIAELRKIQTETPDAFKGVSEKTLNQLNAIETNVKKMSFAAVASSGSEEAPKMVGMEEDIPISEFRLQVEKWLADLQTEITAVKQKNGAEKKDIPPNGIDFSTVMVGNDGIDIIIGKELNSICKNLSGNINVSEICDTLISGITQLFSNQSFWDSVEEDYRINKGKNKDGYKKGDVVPLPDYKVVASIITLTQEEVKEQEAKEKQEAEEDAERQRQEEEEAEMAANFDKDFKEWSEECAGIRVDTTKEKEFISKALLGQGLLAIKARIVGVANPVVMGIDSFYKAVPDDEETGLSSWSLKQTCEELKTALNQIFKANKRNVSNKLYDIYKAFPADNIYPGAESLAAWLEASIPVLENHFVEKINIWVNECKGVVGEYAADNRTCKFSKSSLSTYIQDRFEVFNGQDMGNYYNDHFKGLIDGLGDTISQQEIDTVFNQAMNSIANQARTTYKTLLSDSVDINYFMLSLPNKDNFLLALDLSRISTSSTNTKPNDSGQLDIPEYIGKDILYKQSNFEPKVKIKFRNLWYLMEYATLRGAAEVPQLRLFNAARDFVMGKMIDEETLEELNKAKEELLEEFRKKPVSDKIGTLTVIPGKYEMREKPVFLDTNGDSSFTLDNTDDVSCIDNKASAVKAVIINIDKERQVYLVKLICTVGFSSPEYVKSVNASFVAGAEFGASEMLQSNVKFSFNVETTYEDFENNNAGQIRVVDNSFRYLTDDSIMVENIIFIESDSIDIVKV